MKRIQTPRGIFEVEKIFKSREEAEQAGYGHYFTHYEGEKEIDVFIKQLGGYRVNVGIII